jgi:hypothetical protein
MESGRYIDSSMHMHFASAALIAVQHQLEWDLIARAPEHEVDDRLHVQLLATPSCL